MNNKEKADYLIKTCKVLKSHHKKELIKRLEDGRGN